MSTRRRYTGLREAGVEDGRKMYWVVLQVGTQQFTLRSDAPEEEAEWMRDQLAGALQKIIDENK